MLGQVSIQVETLLSAGLGFLTGLFESGDDLKL